VRRNFRRRSCRPLLPAARSRIAAGHFRPAQIAADNGIQFVVSADAGVNLGLRLRQKSHGSLPPAVRHGNDPPSIEQLCLKYRGTQPFSQNAGLMQKKIRVHPVPRFMSLDRAPAQPAYGL
jgi:hypothetical protein